MQVLRTGLLLPAVALVAGCVSGSGGDPDTFTTESAFVETDAAGVFPGALDEAVIGTQLDEVGNIAARRAGVLTDDSGLVAEAGIFLSVPYAAAPAVGTVVYDGSYNVVALRNAELVGDNIETDNTFQGGAIELTAEFAAGTLTGSNLGGILDPFTLTGSVAANTVGGSVIWAGIARDLRRFIDADRMIGAFDGENDDTVYA